MKLAGCEMASGDRHEKGGKPDCRNAELWSAPAGGSVAHHNWVLPSPEGRGWTATGAFTSRGGLGEGSLGR